MELFLHFLPLVIALAIPLFLIHAIFWGMTFTIDVGHVRVRVYGLTVRKVALSDIEYAAQDWAFWNEHWTNTVKPGKMVLLRRRTGLFKNFLISPSSPIVFLNELGAYGVKVR
jgi:hypothetical protein